MLRGTRYLFRLLTGLVIVALTSATTAAYAMPAPPPPDGLPPLTPITGPPETTVATGTSFIHEVTWLVSGAALALMVVAIVGIAAFLVRRRQTGQLQPQ